jgi:TrmH family RNA methyltransferase
VPEITSRRNQLVAQFRAAAEPGGDSILLDGPHLLEEAVAAGLEILAVAVLDEPGGGRSAVAAIEEARQRGARVYGVNASVLAAMSPVRSPSGVVAIARRPSTDLEQVLADRPQFVLGLAAVQDPGNVGAIVRAAEGCGATGVIAGEGTADPFGWKALRGSMGSAFRIAVAVREPLDRAIRAARDRGLRIFSAVPHGGTPLPRCDLRVPACIVLGGEGSGLPGDVLALADEPLTIPMRRPVESLNVATAAALITYEAMRQRELAT